MVDDVRAYYVAPFSLRNGTPRVIIWLPLLLSAPVLQERLISPPAPGLGLIGLRKEVNSSDYLPREGFTAES